MKEEMDSGYPRGVELTNRMVEIVAVADIYDALLMPRSYRPISYDKPYSS